MQCAARGICGKKRLRPRREFPRLSNQATAGCLSALKVIDTLVVRAKAVNELCITCVLTLNKLGINFFFWMFES